MSSTIRGYTMNEYEKAIIKRLDILNSILTVFLKFALDSSSYKSKTTEEIKSTSTKENEILNSIYENSK
tara:strand:- start:231 stop:437 length:207 start_codon:yes stop_codon:yes gene_type:complete